MPSQVKSKVHPELQLVSALAKHLLSPSRFENSAQLAQTAARDGLRCLAALDKPTANSLPPVPEAPEAPVTEDQPAMPSQPVASPNPPAASAAASSPAPAPAPALSSADALTSRFGTRKDEYKDGLKHPSVIEALLSYHSRTRVQGTAQAPLAGFSPARVAQVAAQPKKTFVHRPGTTRVFRTRG